MAFLLFISHPLSLSPVTVVSLWNLGELIQSPRKKCVVNCAFQKLLSSSSSRIQYPKVMDVNCKK